MKRTSQQPVACVSCSVGTVPWGGRPTQEQWVMETRQGMAERGQQGCSMPSHREGQHQGRVFGEDHCRQTPARCLLPARRHTEGQTWPSPQHHSLVPGAATCDAELTLRPSAHSHLPQEGSLRPPPHLGEAAATQTGSTRAGGSSAHALPSMGQSVQHVLPRVTCTIETGFW